jgi:hypothetical protein
MTAIRAWLRAYALVLIAGLALLSVAPWPAALAMTAGLGLTLRWWRQRGQRPAATDGEQDGEQDEAAGTRDEAA